MYTIFAFLIAIGLLVTIHELGHYAVARLCGVKVLRFSLGFGPVLVKRQDKRGTEWALSLVPLGGYVKMLDEREAPVLPEQLHEAFNSQSAYKRFAIVAAGPLANFLLAIVLYSIVHWIGVNDIAPVVQRTEVMATQQSIGFEEKDTIIAIAGTPVQGWSQVRELMVPYIIQAQAVDVTVKNSNQQMVQRRLNFEHFDLTHFENTGQIDRRIDTMHPNYTLPLSLENVDLLDAFGIRIWSPLYIAEVLPSGAAADSGLQARDKIVSVNNQPASSVGVFIQQVRSSMQENGEITPLTVEVERAGQTLEYVLLPRKEQGVARVGIQFEGPEIIYVRYGIFSGLLAGIDKTYSDTLFHVKMLGKLLTNSISWKNLSGPVTIAEFAGKTAETGLVYYIRFIALISISMGILNLLPVPVLDGGHLLFYAIEMVRGKPLSEKVMAVGQQIGLLLILMLMSVALINDFSRLFK